MRLKIVSRLEGFIIDTAYIILANSDPVVVDSFLSLMVTLSSPPTWVFWKPFCAHVNSVQLTRSVDHFFKRNPHFHYQLEVYSVAESHQSVLNSVRMGLAEPPAVEPMSSEALSLMPNFFLCFSGTVCRAVFLSTFSCWWWFLLWFYHHVPLNSMLEVHSFQSAMASSPLASTAGLQWLLTLLPPQWPGVVPQSRCSWLFLFVTFCGRVSFSAETSWWKTFHRPVSYNVHFSQKPYFSLKLRLFLSFSMITLPLFDRVCPQVSAPIYHESSS